MSFATVNQCVHDAAFQGRVTACVAQEGAAQPTTALWQVIWPVAGASDVEAAYASALAAGKANPGGDETVITDAMILSHVQPLLPVEP